MENILLFVHILCAAIWIGGATISAILLISAKNLEPLQAKAIIQNIANLAKFIFAPMAVLVFITGTGLISVVEGLSFGDPWISGAFLGIFISIILGAVFHARAGRKALAAAESGDSQSLTSAIKSWLIIAYIDLAIIISVLALMVFKPGA